MSYWQIRKAKRAHGMDRRTRKRTIKLIKSLTLPVGKRRVDT